MERRWDKLAMLFKLEATYGTDATPVAANAIIGISVTFTPIEGQEISRDLMLPYLGNQGMILAGIYARLEFEFEIAGSGTAGVPPRWGDLVRAAGMAETITAGTDVQYTIIEDGVESGSMYFISDKVQHVLLGCQVNIAPSLTPSTVPRFSNPLKNGLLGTNYGTINDVGGFGGIISKLFGGGEVDANGIIQSALGAATTTGAMHVQAAVVNIGGAGIGGLDVSRMFNAANSNVAGGSMAQFAAAIRNIESRGSGGYNAMGPITANGDRAYGAYQVMGANIPAWTKSALGSSLSPQQFLASQEAQDAVFNKIFGGYVGKYGASGAAQAWFAGPGSIGRSGNPGDMLGTSVSQYVGKFESEIQKLAGASSKGMDTASAALERLAGVTTQTTEGLGQFGGGLESLARNFASMGGGGGNILGSLFPGLGGFASKQLSGAIASGSWGLWSDGGYTGSGGVYEPRGIVHAGEVVWSQRDVARAGGPAVVDAMRLGRKGYSNGGVVDGEHVYRAAPSGYFPASTTPAQSQPPAQINIHNYAGANVRSEEESDGRGGRRTNIFVEESVSDAISRPGSAARGTLGRSYGLRPTMIKR